MIWKTYSSYIKPTKIPGFAIFWMFIVSKEWQLIVKFETCSALPHLKDRKQNKNSKIKNEIK